MADEAHAVAARLGQTIRDARKTRGWSQIELGDKAGVSRPTVARVERGDVVSTETITKLASVLGLELQLVEQSKRRTRTRVALPDDDYLIRIGEVAYSVSSLEWTLLGDLHRLSVRLPKGFTLKELEPLTTGTIAARTRRAAEDTEDSEIKAYLAAAADALTTVSTLRNNMLHARPATRPVQDQRLNRAEVLKRQTTGKRFWIDDEWFDRAIMALNAELDAVNAVRPPFG